MMVKPDQLQLTNLLSRKGNTGIAGMLSPTRVALQSSISIRASLHCTTARESATSWSIPTRRGQLLTTNAAMQQHLLMPSAGAYGISEHGQLSCGSFLVVGEVWRGTLWGKAVAIKLLPLVGVDDRQLDCLRREVAVLLHTTGECKQVRTSYLLNRACVTC